MADMHLELKNPAVLRALRSAPAMQRWELLRRAKEARTAAWLAEEARASLADIQSSLDLLVEAGLVEVCATETRRAAGRRRTTGYRTRMQRLIVRWDRSDPASLAAWREHTRHARDLSRAIIDEAAGQVGAEAHLQCNCSGAISVLLLDEDAMRVREALRAVYAMLAEADARARARGGSAEREPYHVAFDLQRLWDAPMPMAEFFVIESSIVERETRALHATAGRLLSRREHEIARLLEGGMSRPQIARRLGISAHTVVTISKSIYRKLGVRSRAELAARLRLA